jgi:hypothetical protein
MGRALSLWGVRCLRWLGADALICGELVLELSLSVRCAREASRVRRSAACGYRVLIEGSDFEVLRFRGFEVLRF